MKWLVCLLLAVLFVPWVRGDVLTTTDGKRFEGQVYTESGKVWVRTPNSRLGFEPNEVRAVTPSPTVFDEHRARLAAIKKDDLVANEAFLKWCEDRGLREEMREQARRVYVLRSARLVMEPLDRSATEFLALWCQQYDLLTEAKKLYLLLYTAELKILRADDVSGHLALARWCAERGLLTESKREYLKVLREEPENQESLIALGYGRPENNRGNQEKVADSRSSSSRTAERTSAVTSVSQSNRVTYRQPRYIYYQVPYDYYPSTYAVYTTYSSNGGYQNYYGWNNYRAPRPYGVSVYYRDKNWRAWSGSPRGNDGPRHNVSAPKPRPRTASNPAPPPKRVGVNGPGYFGF